MRADVPGFVPIVLALVFSAGCAPSKASTTVRAAPPGEESDPGRQAPPRHAKVHFREINGRRFPYPLLRATVRDEPTWLIADTGASHHVIGSALARRLRIEAAPSSIQGRGHTGAPVEVRAAVRPEIALEGWGALSDHDVLLADLPVIFDQLDLGGVLSPQALAEDADQAVLLSFADGIIELMPEPGALEALAGARSSWLARCTDCVCSTSNEERAATYVVSGRVEGIPVRLGIDSGAERTDFRITSEVGKRLAPRSTAGGKTVTAGRLYTERMVSKVPLLVGDVLRELDVALVPGDGNPACPSDGNLGMDVLSSCTLVLARHAFAGRCR